MPSLLEIIEKTKDYLSRKGIENPRLNAELLASHVLGLTRMQLYLQFERPLSEVELARLRPLVKRRGDQEPLQYVTGEAHFHGLVLKVDRRVLIPRPETEQLLEKVKESLPNAPRRMLDLGTGSGAIALAAAKLWPESQVVAVDQSEDALAVARANAESLGLSGRVEFRSSDWFSAIQPGESFDLVASNPPYLTPAEVAAAKAEVREHEPRSALTPGPTGLEALELILAQARRFITPGGLLACETGIEQHAALAQLATAHGYRGHRALNDLAGRPRFFLAFA